MNDPLSTDAALLARIERATAPLAGVDAAGEDAALREAWLALGQTLAMCAPRDGRVTLSPATILASPHSGNRSSPSVSAKAATAARWPWAVAGALLLAAAIAGSLAPTARHRISSPSSPPGETEIAANGANGPAWDDDLDELLADAANDTAALWLSWDGGEPGHLGDALDALEQELEDDTF